jgi:hypothetical protein
MGRYIRAAYVDDAYQVKFSEADKEEAKKGLAVSSHGSHIKHEDGVFSVFIHLGEDGKQVKEGDWVVTEGQKSYVVSADDFDENFQEIEEDDDQGEDVQSKEPEDVKSDEPPADIPLVHDAPPITMIPVAESIVEPAKEAQAEGSETAVD